MAAIMAARKHIRTEHSALFRIKEQELSGRVKKPR
jgi:hypothetical protein